MTARVERPVTSGTLELDAEEVLVIDAAHDTDVRP